jgi:hypothetical protein
MQGRLRAPVLRAVLALDPRAPELLSFAKNLIPPQWPTADALATG